MPEEIKKENHGNNLMSWDVPEYVKYKRSTGWYIWLGIISLAVLVYSFFTSNFLLGVIVVIFVTIIIAHNLGDPGTVNFSIYEDGVILGSKHKPWTELKSFWIIYEPPEVKTLYFDLKGLRPSLSVDLMDQNPVKVKEIIIKFLKEDLTQDKELIGDELSRLLKL
jgi:hypothetical protein